MTDAKDATAPGLDFVPEGHLRIARRFQPGGELGRGYERVPEGRLKRR